jgi:hypothetical protein
MGARDVKSRRDAGARRRSRAIANAILAVIEKRMRLSPLRNASSRRASAFRAGRWIVGCATSFSDSAPAAHQPPALFLASPLSSAKVATALAETATRMGSAMRMIGFLALVSVASHRAIFRQRRDRLESLDLGLYPAISFVPLGQLSGHSSVSAVPPTSNMKAEVFIARRPFAARSRRDLRNDRTRKAARTHRRTP